jgi:Uma2 family endonuclease
MLCDGVMDLGYPDGMRAVFLELPEWIAKERILRGDDRRDEVWEGVLHVSPQPTSPHQLFATRLVRVLFDIARRRGFEAACELGHYRLNVERDYRVPDLAIVAPAHLSERGIEGRAELVVELLSPNDESREKLPFYARVGTQEAWLIDPRTYALEVFDLRAGTIVPVAARDDGAIVSPSLGLVLAVVAGPCLEIRDGDTVHVA